MKNNRTGNTLGVNANLGAISVDSNISPNNENLRKFMAQFSSQNVDKDYSKGAYFDEKGITATNGIKLLHISNTEAKKIKKGVYAFADGKNLGTSFPPYTNVLEKKHEYCLNIKANDLLKSINQIAKLSINKSHYPSVAKCAFTLVFFESTFKVVARDKDNNFESEIFTTIPDTKSIQIDTEISFDYAVFNVLLKLIAKYKIQYLDIHFSDDPKYGFKTTIDTPYGIGTLVLMPYLHLINGISREAPSEIMEELLMEMKL